MKSKNALCGRLAIGCAGRFRSDQAIPVYSGSETNITLPPGTYIITAYGAPGGGRLGIGTGGGLEPELSGEFNFPASTTLTLLLVGNGGSFGGGGSIIDSSAITILPEVSGIASPDDPANGEIIITVVLPPIGITTISSLSVVVCPQRGRISCSQMTTNLAGGNWVTVTNGVLVFGLQMTSAPGTAFFRLH